MINIDSMLSLLLLFLHFSTQKGRLLDLKITHMPDLHHIQLDHQMSVF